MATFECATNILMALDSAVEQGTNASDILVNRSLLNKARYALLFLHSSSALKKPP